MGACDVKLTLYNNRRQYFTSLDTLSGKVELNVNSEITVENVQVKFEGFAKTKIEYKEKVHDGNNSHTRTSIQRESHTLAYKVVTLFPPPNVREVSDNKKFTLTPGKYEYYFDIKVPLVNECGDPTAENYNYLRHFEAPLPPTISEDMFNVQYILKVTVRRASWFKTNIREIKYPHLRPFDPIDQIISRTQPLFLRKDETFKGMVPKRIALTEKPTGPESYKVPQKKSISGQSSRFFKAAFGGKVDEPDYAEETNVPFALEIRVNAPFVRLDQSPDLGLYITSKYGPQRYKGIDNESSGLGCFYLQSLKIELASTVNLVAASAKKLLLRQYPFVNQKDINKKIDLADLSPSALHTETSNAQPYELELDSSIFQDAAITANIPPSFKTCNMEVSYKLRVIATFVESVGSWSSKKIEIAAPVTLLSGIPAPEEYVEMTQIPPHIAQQILKRYPREMGGMSIENIFSNDTTVEAEAGPSSYQFSKDNVDGNQLPSYQSATQS